MYFRVVIKNRTTFNAADFPYATALSVSGSNYSITYYDDDTLTAPAHTATYSISDYLVYVVPQN